LGVLVKPALISFAILLITVAVSRLTSRRLRLSLERGGFQVNVAILLARALWLAVWAVATLLILYQFGVGLTPLAAFIGVVGLAASLSLQQVLQNLVAGVYILAEQPFAIRDTIAVVGPNGVNHQGRVEDIQMRTTHLRSPDDELIMVPNAAIFGGVVTNRTAVGGFATHCTLTFPRTTDPATVRSSAFPLLKQLPDVLPAPEPQLRVDRVSADTWTATLSFWAQTDNAASDVIWTIAHAFPDATVNDTPAAPV
ncbi:MAG TPA: mechanosensitive ion channel domain-containing protein, partial [Chloroflexota bacterium]